MFKFVIMLLCVLVQNELNLNLCILLFLILFFLFFLVKIDKLFLKKLEADVAFL